MSLFFNPHRVTSCSLALHLLGNNVTCHWLDGPPLMLSHTNHFLSLVERDYFLLPLRKISPLSPDWIIFLTRRHSHALHLCAGRAKHRLAIRHQAAFNRRRKTRGGEARGGNKRRRVERNACSSLWKNQLCFASVAA